MVKIKWQSLIVFNEHWIQRVQCKRTILSCFLTKEWLCTLLLVSPGVNISCLDGVKEELSHSDTFNVDEVGLEQSLWGLKPLSSHLDHTTIWQLEARGRDGMKRKWKMTPLVMSDFTWLNTVISWLDESRMIIFCRCGVWEKSELTNKPCYVLLQIY